MILDTEELGLTWKVRMGGVCVPEFGPKRKALSGTKRQLRHKEAPV